MALAAGDRMRLPDRHTGGWAVAAIQQDLLDLRADLAHYPGCAKLSAFVSASVRLMNMYGPVKPRLRIVLSHSWPAEEL
jgi:hypothetical protein